MEFLKKLKRIFSGRPGAAPVDFTRLPKNQKVDFLMKEAAEFNKKYGQVIKKLAHE